jgi:hypothetical protein
MDYEKARYAGFFIACFFFFLIVALALRKPSLQTKL